MRRPAVLLALVLAAALAAGCGGGGGSSASNDYVKAVNAAQESLAQRFGALRRGVTATSTPEQDRRTLQAYERAVDDTVARLRRAQPPADLRGLHDRFVGEISAYGAEVRRARQALRSPSRERVLAARRRLVTEVTRITARISATIDAMNRRLRG